MLSKIRFIVLVLLSFCPIIGFPETSHIHTGDNHFKVLQEISSEEWNKSIPESVRKLHVPVISYNSDYEISRYLKVEVDNHLSESYWILEFLDQMELVELHYYSPQSEQWISSFSGDQIPMSQRELAHSLLILPLSLNEGEYTSLFISVQDYQFKNASIRILTPGEFLKTAGKSNALFLFSYGLIIFMAILNIIHFYTSRKKYYLFYALVMFSLVISLLGKHRYLSFLFFPSLPYGYFVYIFFNSLAAMGSLLFTRVFYNIPVKSPVGRLQTFFLIALSFVALLSTVISSPSLGDVMNFLIFPSLILILSLSIKRSIRGDRASRIILLSFIFIIFGVLLDNLNIYMEIKRSTMKDWIALLGTVLHIILINYGMAVRQASLEGKYNSLKKHFHSNVEQRVIERTRELEQHAQYDSLTKLLNRSSLEKKISELEQVSAGNLGILFADLDNFKYYNDCYGHNTGDLILKEISHFLTSHIRYHDLVYRFGGDEFLILMPDTVAVVAESLSKRLHTEFQTLAGRICDDLMDDSCRLGLSLGFANWQPGRPLWDVIFNADQALLKAKEQGKNRILHFSELS